MNALMATFIKYFYHLKPTILSILMLSEPTITAFLPTVKPEDAKQFYRNTLGLKLVSEDNYALEFKGVGALLRITIVDRFMPYPFTVLGFKIMNIESQIRSLLNKGVAFVRYDHFEQDDLAIWTSPSKAKIAWFKDPDGNLLSLIEHNPT